MVVWSSGDCAVHVHGTIKGWSWGGLFEWRLWCVLPLSSLVVVPWALRLGKRLHGLCVGLSFVKGMLDIIKHDYILRVILHGATDAGLLAGILG